MVFEARDFKRLVGREGGVFINETSGLTRKTREVASLLSSMQGYDGKLAIYSLKRVLTQTTPCWHSDLTLPASKTVRNKCLFFISYSVYGTLLEQLELTETAE